jgi:choline monooxygenase
MARSEALLADRPLDRDPARSLTLPSHLYTSPEAFAREREAIFFRNWHLAGHVSDLPEAGSYITTAIHDQNVFICRGKDGALRGFYNVCAHRAHELLSGTGRAKVITCPYHAWSYHLTGELRSARGAEALEGFEPRDFCLTPVKVETFGPLVFFNLDPKAPPLARRPAISDRARDPYPGLCPDEARRGWQPGHRSQLESRRRQLSRMLPLRAGPSAFADLVDLDNYRSVCHDIHSSHIGRKVRPQNKAFHFDPDAPVQHSGFWWLWPMATVNIMPGDPGWRSSGGIRWPTRTEQVSSPIPGRQAHAATGKVREYSGSILSVEDNGICESVQRGLASRGYRQGRFIVDPERSELSEHAVHHFHQLVAEALGI